MTSVAVAVAPFVAMAMVALLGSLPYFRPMTGGGPLPVDVGLVPFFLAGGAGLLMSRDLRGAGSVEDQRRPFGPQAHVVAASDGAPHPPILPRRRSGGARSACLLGASVSGPANGRGIS